MHLAVNASDLGRKRGGNESYMLGLLSGLAAVAPRAAVRVSVAVSHQGAAMMRAVPGFSPLRSTLCLRTGQAASAVAVVDVGAYRRVPSLLWQQTTLLRRLRPDWFVSTYFLPPLTPGRAALLVHDLSFRARPDFFPRAVALYMHLLTGQAIRRAEVVVALSEFTRQELMRFYPVAPERVVVVPPGVGPEYTSQGDPAADRTALAALGVSQPYVLAVGNIHPRKNLERLLGAWLSLSATHQAVPRMVWAGLDRWGSSRLLNRARAAGVQLLGYVEPARLPALYRQAEALAYPSLYEGFGLPPLEAMACGTPVLTANTTSLPEAVGSAAVTVCPTDVGAIADGLARVLFDVALRRDLRARGLGHAAQFRWERAAEQLLRALALRSA